MDADVSRTLAELERKLHELERVLAVEAARQHHPRASSPFEAARSEISPGEGCFGEPSPHAGAPLPGPPGEPPPHAGAPLQGVAQGPGPPQARLVDESIERGQPFPPPRAPEAAAGAASTPPAQSRRPEQAGQSPPSPSSGLHAQPAAPASPRARDGEKAAGAPVPADESIELAQLVRFRDRLESTLHQLVEEYTAIITLAKSPSGGEHDPSRTQQDQPPQGSELSGI